MCLNIFNILLEKMFPDPIPSSPKPTQFYDK